MRNLAIYGGMITANDDSGSGAGNSFASLLLTGLVRPARELVFAVAPVVVVDIGHRIEVPPIEAFGGACHRFQVIRTKGLASWPSSASTRAPVSASPTDGDTQMAWNIVVMLGGQHGIHVNNGGMMGRTAGIHPPFPFSL